MNKKFGLGKGLGALIPDQTIEENEAKNNENINLIDINLIKANSTQPRKNFDERKIIQLSESIKEHGIIQPIILKSNGDTYTIIAGERRWRAAKVAGIKEVPAIIMDLSDKEILEVSLIENIQRQDLNPIEEALAYKRLIEDFKLTQEQLSNRIGKSRTAVTNLLRLLNIDNRVKEYLIDGVISEGHARALLSLEDKDLQYEYAQMIIDEALSVRQTEKLIKNINNKKRLSKKSVSDVNPYYVDIKNKLENLFGTKVQLLDKKDKGKIEIEYYSSEDLQRILDILEIKN
ncbi:ParB/RepB/Spo0J family partition protein [Clostridium sp. P21]|uniref:ParB/RepB/Spo0J family partition protein n=1 Tax=Clostridium muellerianum TaxID=2716538 RepID=A0A7Y0HMX0_9CLOT|nr:ParB/RepB/Spo0J family partition protein [Clostridium muellerianum]NMM62042.1 ParB/RepB/Spo0J family partition protein [Clostridium muellerianum]